MFGSYRVTALAKANDNQELSKFLSNKRHLVNCQSKKSGRTALQIACKNGNLDMVLMLILRGADLDIKDYNGNSPLMLALEHKFDDIATTLLERGAHHQTLVNNNLQTPLHVACCNNCGVAAMFLISKKDTVNLDALDANNDTPLHLALLNDNKDIAQSLLIQGVEYNFPNNNDLTALDIAKARHATEFLLFVNSLELSRSSGSVDRMIQSTLEQTDVTINKLRAQYNHGFYSAEEVAESKEAESKTPLVASTDIESKPTETPLDDCVDCRGGSAGSAVVLRNGVPVAVHNSAAGAANNSKMKPKRKMLEKLLAATMFRSGVISSGNRGGAVRNPQPSSSGTAASGGSNSHAASANASSSGTVEAVIPLIEANLHMLPTELIANQLVALDPAHDATTAAAVTQLVNAHGAPVAPTIDGEYEDTTVAETLNTSVKSARKKKVKRAQLRKIQHRFNAQPRDEVVESQILAMIVPTRQRKSMLLLRRATLLGYCTVM